VKRGLEDRLHGICPTLLSSLLGVWSKLAFLPIIVMSVYKGTFVLIGYIQIIFTSFNFKFNIQIKN
jgi:hypothetical protein